MEWLALTGQPFFFVSRFRNMEKKKKTLRNRIVGRIVHVAASKTGTFWCIAKADVDNESFFIYGKNVMNSTVPPKRGAPVEFTKLPPTNLGKLPRATEVWMLQPHQCPMPPKPARIEVSQIGKWLVTELIEGTKRSRISSVRV
jgi:hypothetical protein